MSSFFSTLKRGQIYLQTWPLEAKLGIIFPENRIIKATKFAQKFMPFMAVKGLKEVLAEVERYTEPKEDLMEDRKDLLDRKLSILQGFLEISPDVVVTYFEPDKRKAGGKYLTVTAQLKDIQMERKRIILSSGEKIPFENIKDLDSKLFEEIE